MQRYRRTTLIAVGCLAALAGIGLARRIDFDFGLIFLLFAPLLVMLLRKPRTALLAAVLIGLGLGLLRGSIYMQHLAEIQKYSGQKVTIEATVLSDAVYGYGSQLEFTAGSLRVVTPTNEILKGKIRASGFGEPMIYRGDTVRITGKLYPTRGGYQARMSYSQLERTGLDSSPVHSFTRKFAAGIQSTLPEPMASFGLGILIGQRTTLPDELVQQLTMVGLIHIVAVSGYNLTILVRAAARLKLPSKFQQLVLSVGLVIFFLLVTGFSASIVRAAVISLLGLWAWYYGRQIRPIVLILFAAALTGLVNPFYVWSDLGWYLSFLAFFGVLIIAPMVACLLAVSRKAMTMVLIETLAAEIMTLPVIMLIFGHVSMVSIAANALVVPLIPVAMLLTAVAAAAGALTAPIAGWFAWPASMFLTYILDIVQLLAVLPFAAQNFSITTPMMICLYALIIIFVTVTHRKLKSKRLLAEMKI